jgi:hypothetical protein
MEQNNTSQHKSFLWHLDFEPFTWHTFYGEQCPPFVTEENKEAWKRYLKKVIKKHLKKEVMNTIPQIMEKNRPDAAYAIAMALCKTITIMKQKQ